MCLIAFSWQPECGRLRLLANRDEFYARPTASADWWPDQPHIWAGRDLQAGGTWLGVNRAGRFAALTNIREGDMRVGKRSRGELVSDFLSSNMSAADYLTQVLSRGSDYAGFNLLLGDMNQRELWYGANRDGGEARQLPAGNYGLSNALLDTPWPKVERLKRGLAEIAAQPNEQAIVEKRTLQLLNDTEQAAVEQLPDTGVASDLELLLSSIFIQIPERDYGTRAQTMLDINQGRLHIVEQGRAPDGAVLAINRAHFTCATKSGKEDSLR